MSSKLPPYYLQESQYSDSVCSIFNRYSQLQVCPLEAAKCLLGGMSAWVTRHTKDTFQIVNVIGSSAEIASSLRILLMRSAQQLQNAKIQLVGWNHYSFLCVGLSPEPENDGCTYMLCVQFDSELQLTERTLAIINGLRSSLRDHIRCWVIRNFSDDIKSPVVQSIVCSCCCRLQILEHGKVLWEDFSSQRAGRRPSLRICDECVFSLYDLALQDEIGN